MKEYTKDKLLLFLLIHTAITVILAYFPPVKIQYLMSSLFTRSFHSTASEALTKDFLSLKRLIKKYGTTAIFLSLSSEGRNCLVVFSSRTFLNAMSVSIF